MNKPPPRPGASNRPPPPTVTSTQRPPANVKDALSEARAIAGGSLGRTTNAPGSMSASAVKARKVVLLVDPDAAMRARMRAALEPYYDVIEAKDGMEAVEMAASMQPPAMIVSENVMPRVDGFTLAKVLRQNPIMKKVPIMFVSAKNTPQDVTQALMVGACQYVLKTTPVGDIVAKIRKIVV
jgi:CheY-like chemotaxis protein